MAIEKFPYQAVIYVLDSFHCGASIIHESFVLSAAHCVEQLGVDKMTVGVGSADLGGHERYAIDKLIMHPDYSTDQFYILVSDAALLKLKKKLQFGTTVQPITLPSALDTSLYVGRLLTVSGFGATAEGGKDSNRLLSTEVQIVSMATCRMLYGEKSLTIHRSMFCARSDGQDACQGDSGGPIVADNVLYGIISFGLGCGSEFPGVYTRVVAIRPWLEEQIGI